MTCEEASANTAKELHATATALVAGESSGTTFKRWRRSRTSFDSITAVPTEAPIR
jgi:hypothetical protein